MKKITATVMSVLMASATLLGAGCGGDNENKDGISVTYYKGGYGSAWIEKSAADFETATGIHVNLTASSELDCRAYTNLKSGKNLSDVYVCASSSWASWVTQGLIADLSSVYDTQVTTKDGNKAIKDFMDQEIKDKFYLERRVGSGDYKPWVMPWSVSIKSLVYNVDIMKEVTHVSATEVEGIANGTKWTRPPETMAEFAAYFEDVIAYDGGKGEVVPFGWTGKNPEGFFNFLYPVWAQYQGVTESKVEGEGSFYDFWNLGNDVILQSATDKQKISLAGYDQTGLAVAFDTLRSLIIDTEKQDYKNGLPDASGLTPQELQKVIVANSVDTNCAVALGSSYLEYEAGNNGYLDSDKDGKQDYEIRFMAVPSLDGYEGKDLCYTPVGDVMFVPAKASNIEKAKQFLAFMCNQEQLEAFTTLSGSLRPFNYDARSIEGAEYSAFTQSVFDVFYDSTHLYEFPIGTEQAMVSYAYRYEKISLVGTTSPNTIYTFLKTKTGAEIAGEIKNNLKEKDLNNWITRYHLEGIDN